MVTFLVLQVLAAYNENQNAQMYNEYDINIFG